MQSRNMILYNIYTREAKSFATMGALAKFIGKNNLGNIVVIAKGGGDENYLTVDNKYTIFYQEEFTLYAVQARLKKIKKFTRRTPIIAKDILLNKEYRFSSLRSASKELNIDRRSISRVLKGLRDEIKGYTFEYLNPIIIPKSMEEISFG